MPAQDLPEVLLYEDLLADGVDVRQVAPLVAAGVLGAVEGHGFVDGDVARPIHAPLLEEYPALRVYNGETERQVSYW